MTQPKPQEKCVHASRVAGKSICYALNCCPMQRGVLCENPFNTVKDENGYPKGKHFASDTKSRHCKL